MVCVFGPPIAQAILRLTCRVASCAELETRSEKKKRRALEKERARQRKAAKAAEHVDLEANKHDVSTDTEPGMDDTFASGIGSVVMTPPEVPLATLPSKTPNAFDWLRANT